MTPSNIYLHEMNRSSKTNNIGVWTYPLGKIGLIYASDYVLSLGAEALAITGDEDQVITGSTKDNAAKLKTGWLHYTNDVNLSADWALARTGADDVYYSAACLVAEAGYISDASVTSAYGVTPVFYLTSETTLSGGTGTYTDPYIIG